MTKGCSLAIPKSSLHKISGGVLQPPSGKQRQSILTNGANKPFLSETVDGVFHEIVF
jgi:hypothetical protein